MNISVENTIVEEITSFKVTTTFLFTKEQMESDETFTVKELFDAVTEKEPICPEEKEGLQEDDILTATIKAHILQSEDQILSTVKSKLNSLGQTIPLDQDIRVKIRNLKG